jgi:mRNA-degrading endonuclease RelE of RelBE toxin-antitoxin system
LSDLDFEIKLTRAALKDFARLRQWKAEIEASLSELERNPVAGDMLKGSLRGVRVLHLRIKGSGEARIAYVVREDMNRCVVFAIGPRENFYELAGRRFDSLEL